MPQILYAGIDVSAGSCVLCCIDDQGNQLAPAASFTNDLPGADGLAEHLLTLAAKCGVEAIHVGVEATSVYGTHLLNFLAEHPGLAGANTLIYELNPSLVAAFKKTFSKRPKTDAQDAFAIAQRVRFGQLTPYRPAQDTTAPLKQLTRLRLHLVHLLATEQNRAAGAIFLKFSNYRQDKPFSSTFGKASLAVLEDFFPDDLLALEIDDLARFVLQNGNNRLKNPTEIAAALKTAANRAYRLHPKMQNAVEVVLSLTTKNIAFLKDQLKKLDRVITQELKAFPQTLTTVRGLGPVLAAGIIAEVGNIARFPGERALAQYAGLTWSRYQSGNFDAEERRLTKVGNRYLRYYLVEAANSLRVHNEEYKAYYQAKFQEVPKHQHKRALVLTARKLVRLVFALLSKGQIYQVGR